MRPLYAYQISIQVKCRWAKQSSDRAVVSRRNRRWNTTHSCLNLGMPEALQLPAYFLIFSVLDYH